ncbi:MAG: hypothetical protein ABGY96_17930 [bacterium]|nr:hypothetical protein [Gammaproteobacteria bacterium]
MSRTQTSPVKEKTSEQIGRSRNQSQIFNPGAFSQITTLLGIITVLAALVYTTTWLTLSAWQ